jgi:hypothetical protein
MVSPGNRPDTPLRLGLLASTLLIIIMIGYGVLRFPAIVDEGGVLSFSLPVILLLIYGFAVVCGTHRYGSAHRALLRTGTGFGLAAGVLFVATIAVESLTALSGRVMTPLTIGLMILIFGVFSAAGWWGTRPVGKIHHGILASVWSALVSVLVALLFGFFVDLVFSQRLEHNLQSSAEYLRSGIQDLGTFAFYNTLDSASTHLLEAPQIAIVFGALGSFMSKLTTRYRGVGSEPEDPGDR